MMLCDCITSGNIFCKDSLKIEKAPLIRNPKVFGIKPVLFLTVLAPYKTNHQSDADFVLEKLYRMPNTYL